MTGVEGDEKNELNRLLASKARKSIKKRIREIEQELQKAQMEIFSKDFERSGYHDTLVDICISAFGNRFLEESKALGLIEAIEGRKDWFRFKIEGKTIKTILANYQKYYQKAVVTRLVKEKAEKKAIQEYRKKSPELFTFE